MKFTITASALIFATLQPVSLLAAEKPAKTRAIQKSPILPAPAPAVLSIIPAQAEPGTSVTISGTGFGESMTVFLGTREIVPRNIENRKIEFTLPPQLEAGIYVLFLKRDDGVTGRAYNFTVLPVRPVLSSLSPDQIDYCSDGKNREIIATGQNFTDKSSLYFDGSVIRSRFISSEAIAFTVPQVNGGLHQVMVRNSPDNSSMPQGLSINTKPEISQVSIGSQYVNYYELYIDGRNFSQSSTIYVDGQRIGGKDNSSAEREKLIYIDCNRLVYQRYPYSTVNKDFRVQVVNQEGQGSQVINVTAP